jgi:hypothetical protein
MKLRALLILLLLILAIVPIYYVNRWMKEFIRPRESAARFLLFLFAVFAMIVVYTILVVGIIVRVFPP